MIEHNLGDVVLLVDMDYVYQYDIRVAELLELRFWCAGSLPDTDDLFKVVRKEEHEYLDNTKNTYYGIESVNTGQQYSVADEGIILADVKTLWEKIHNLEDKRKIALDNYQKTCISTGKSQKLMLKQLRIIKKSGK